MANRSSFRVEEGDILLLGTDGLFDNMHEDMIVDFISKYKVKTTRQGSKNRIYHLSQCMRFPTMWYVRPAKPQISLRIRTV